MKIYESGPRLLGVAFLMPFLWSATAFFTPALGECIDQLRVNKAVRVTYESGRVARITGDADPNMIVESIIKGGSSATPSSRYIRAGVLTVRTISPGDDAQTKFRSGSQMPNWQFKPGDYAVDGTVYRKGSPDRSVSIAFSIKDQRHDMRIGSCNFSAVAIAQVIKIWEGSIDESASQVTFHRMFVDGATMIPLRYERYADAQYRDLIFSDTASEVVPQR